MLATREPALNQRPMAVLELPARAAGAGGVALYLAPGIGIVRIDGNVPKPRDGLRAVVAVDGQSLVFARQRIDVMLLHRDRLALEARRRLLDIDLQMHEAANDAGAHLA